MKIDATFFGLVLSLFSALARSEPSVFTGKGGSKCSVVRNDDSVVVLSHDGKEKLEIVGNEKLSTIEKMIKAMKCTEQFEYKEDEKLSEKDFTSTGVSAAASE